MKTLLRSSLIAVLTISLFAGFAASATNHAFPTAPKPSTSGTGPCCTTSTSVH
jgi:hypothetical protein